jgi:hypothetical protein
MDINFRYNISNYRFFIDRLFLLPKNFNKQYIHEKMSHTSEKVIQTQPIDGSDQNHHHRVVGVLLRLLQSGKNSSPAVERRRTRLSAAAGVSALLWRFSVLLLLLLAEALRNGGVFAIYTCIKNYI